MLFCLLAEFYVSSYILFYFPELALVFVCVCVLLLKYIEN